eukprot:CAMPEP_0168736594 /NCGR_PEP_ID=MMETSP0724-20121128/9941_1 /TAXON_ID=265536 /ORGANISM="Amphiprora sp., Strain CCMP467" /LENGTH=412 /DNA_ID=CAMNT_0008783797 /DNA_START=179 /DNA_END=1417 /DNA_ORIENTATION=-
MLVLYGVLLLVATAAAAAAARAAEHGASNYPSLPALLLDDYGNAVQFQHARNAVERQSSWVWIIVRRRRRTNRNRNTNHDKDDPPEWWVISPLDDDDRHYLREYSLPDRPSPTPTKQPLQDESSSSSSTRSAALLCQPYTGPRRWVHPLLSSFSHTFSNDDDSIQSPQSSSWAVVCVGLGPDAAWLVARLHEYCATVWERTARRLDRTALRTALTALYRRCLAGSYKDNHGNTQDASSQFGPPSLDSLLRPPSNDEETAEHQRKMGWGRPLGVSTVVLELNGNNNDNKNPNQPPCKMVQVHPSGAVQTISSPVLCLGKHAAEFQAWWRTHEQEQEDNTSSLDQHDEDENDDNDDQALLLQTVCQGLAHVLGRERLPQHLGVEIWGRSHGRAAVQRRRVRVADYRTKKRGRFL